MSVYSEESTKRYHGTLLLILVKQNTFSKLELHVFFFQDWFSCALHAWTDEKEFIDSYSAQEDPLDTFTQIYQSKYVSNSVISLEIMPVTVQPKRQLKLKFVGFEQSIYLKIRKWIAEFEKLEVSCSKY